ncbi:glycosyltransferase [Coralloluteibacterium stylophorae]|uniref:Glycosyltransferase n=1 Tax=Coralloluteibacterium stylophorae TaxID=1776034 RepID=A0A8J7VWV1_9GAMM|nr:glycosyltransferase [Coralloluteibacterium stylophorae]MBS7458542.1 glycosyltransferase [Coralloluteibacterium stylophorae]
MALKERTFPIAAAPEHPPAAAGAPAQKAAPRSLPFPAPARPRVALVHYWLVGMRGGEKVLEVLCELFPDADIFTLVADPSRLSDRLRGHRITTSFLQRIGGVRHYQKMLPLMPFALEAFDLTGYDLVISSEAGPAKGVVTRPDALHVCYCHSPMRYVWDLYPQYRAGAGRLARALMSLTAPVIRQWDVTTAARVDAFVANSSYVARRIEKFYRREAAVIHPPVDVGRFAPAPDGPDDYYLCAGQVTPYKRIDLAVDAFTRLGKPLRVIGSGVDDRLRERAGRNVEFLGAVDDATMAHHFAHCRALVFPGVEDFGIVPLEVMASGRPVIAFGRGGALETVVHGETGVLFHEQSVEALIAAVEACEEAADLFDPARLRAHAVSFSLDVFRARLRHFIDARYHAHLMACTGASAAGGGAP